MHRYARMMSEGHKMDVVYYDPYPNKFLEEYIRDYSKLVESRGEPPITIRKLDTVEEVLREADVSLTIPPPPPMHLLAHLSARDMAKHTSLNRSCTI